MKEGISQHIPPIPEHILHDRDRWNRFIKGQTPTDLTGLKEVDDYLNDNLSNFHGTNTTALIANKNPYVRFVLVEKHLNSGNEVADCSKMEEAVKILPFLQDKDIKDLSISKGQLSEWKILDELARKHGVKSVSKSFAISKAIIKHVLERSSCDMKLLEPMNSFIKEAREVEEAVAKKERIFYDQEPFLTFQAAGNEGVQIDSKDDFSYCSDASHFLVVGSYSPKDLKRSSFSNFGKCVHLYAQGSDIIATTANDFLTILDGTSFATSLTIRYVTEDFTNDDLTSAAGIRKNLLSALNGQGFLPLHNYFQYAAHHKKHLHLTGLKFNPVIQDKNLYKHKRLLEHTALGPFIK